MLCYVLEKDHAFNIKKTKKQEISSQLEKEIEELCIKWQVRALHQSGYEYTEEGIVTNKLYESLNPECFVVSGEKIVGYYANHFDTSGFVRFTGEAKTRIGDYDFTDYSNGGKANRGFVEIVPNPDIDSNPYSDLPRFHSQEEYDDYIKWKD